MPKRLSVEVRSSWVVTRQVGLGADQHDLELAALCIEGPRDREFAADVLVQAGSAHPARPLPLIVTIPFESGALLVNVPAETKVPIPK